MAIPASNKIVGDSGHTADHNSLASELTTTKATADAAETPAGAQAKADAAEAVAVQRANHTGTQSADTLTDGSTNRLFSTTEKTKLASVASSATANQTDAYLLDRTHHTGTQASTTISDFTAAVDARITAAGGGGGGASTAADLSFTPAGSISSTNVQDAIEELDAATGGTTTESTVTTTTTLTSADLDTVVACGGTAADYTVTLPTAVGATGRAIIVRGSAALTRFVTVDGNGSETIGGLSSIVLWANEAVTLLSDGTNWNILNRNRRAVACTIRLTADSATAVSGTSTPVPLNGVDLDNTTRAADVANNRIVVPRTGSYRVDGAITFVSPAASARYRMEVYVNGSQVFGHETQAYTTGTFPSPGRGVVIPLVAGDLIVLKGYQASGANRTFLGSATGDACQLAIAEVLA